MNRHTRLLAMGLATAFTLMFASSVFALDSLAPVSTDYKPLTTVPGIFKQGEVTNPVKILKNLYGFAIGIGSVIGVVMIIYAGFEYMYKESISGKSDAKQRIMNVFLGLAVILGSYILLRTINPALVEFNVNLPSGSGRVAHLSIAQNMANDVNARTQVALNQSAAARAKITDLEKEMATLEQKSEQTEADQARIETIKKQIVENKILDSQLRTKADVESVAMNIDNNIYLRAAGEMKNEDNLPARHASAINFFDKQIDELKALDQSNPEVKKAIDQVTARKSASIEEFRQQTYVEKALIQYKDLDSASKKSYGATVIKDIRGDVEIEGGKLRGAGLTDEARRYEERANVRISALCGANFCGN